MRYRFFFFLILFPTVVFANCGGTGGCYGCSDNTCYGCHRIDLFRNPCSDKSCYGCHRLEIPGWWGSVDYLLIWRKSRFFPPLLTRNELGLSPIIGSPGTVILFGDDKVSKSPQSGIRGDVGLWVTPCIGFGTAGWWTGNEKVDFTISGILGNPVFGIPFVSVPPLPGTPDVFVLSDLANSGSSKIDTSNYAWEMDGYVRYRFLASRLFKLDFLGGAMFVRLDDDLDMTSRTTNALIPPTTTIINDHFNVQNDFYAGMLGVLSEIRSRNWSIFFTGKFGLGNMVKKVKIGGDTTIESILGTTVTEGGIFAQPSNIGTHSANQFEILTQLSAQLQLRFWDHFWFTAGYQYMYWPKVALSGEQVDVHVDLLHTVPFPRFELHNASFYIQAATFGLYILY